MHAPPSAAFERHFRRLARRVRFRHALRNLLSGAAAGAVAAAAVAALCWALGLGTARLGSAALVAAGMLFGALRGRARRFSDTELALYLDARLGSAEAVTSALFAAAGTSPGASAVVERAARALAAADPRRLRLRWLSPWHALLPAGLAAVAALSLLPLPSAQASPPAAPGSDLVQDPNVPGLDRIEALAQSAGLSDADRERLRRLANDARKLREDLARGLPRREAQSRVARLRDEVARERQRFDDRSERPGLEASVSALDAREVTRHAAKVLGEGDLVAFDEEMRRLANLAESSSRKAAEQALADAARAAREKGNPKLAALLERQRKLFEERSADARALRELAKKLESALGPEAQRDAQRWNESGSPEAQQRLIESLARALGELSAAERERLAETLQRELGQGGEATPLSKEALEELARKLSTQAGRDALREQLKELAREPSADAERERALDDAERGGAEAQRRLSGVPLPGRGPGAASPGGAPTPGGSGKGAPGGTGSGSGRDEGRGDHAGETPRTGSEELRARANARLLPGAPLGTRSLGRAPARAGETANQLGSGQLGSVGPAEVGAVEGSDVPEEYREHVGRYFEP